MKPNENNRRALKVGVLSILCLHFLVCGAKPARADVTGPGALSRADQLRSIYAGSISFTENNVPLIRLRVTESSKDITIKFPDGIYLLPDGPTGPRIELKGSGTVKITMEDSALAELQYRVRLEKVRAGDVMRVVARKKWWATQGFTVETVEIGSIFGFHGTILDNREVRLVIYPDVRTKKKAKTLAARVKKVTGRNAIVESWITRYPDATIRISVPNRNMTVTAKNLFWLEAPNNSRLTIEDVSFHDQTHGKRAAEHRDLSGTFYAVPNPKGQLTLVQVMDAEKLLKGIVPAEIYPSAHKAALEAQAITARGDLLEKLGKRHLNDPFLLCNEVHCQAHRGENLESKSTNVAVDKTRGKVIFHDGHIVPAVYHASCGGHTERNEDVWPGAIAHPALRGRQDVSQSGARSSPPLRHGGAITDEALTRVLESPSKAFCSLPKKGKAAFRWLRPISLKELQLLDPKKNLGTLLDLKVIERGVGGHAMIVRLVGTKGSYDISPELSIRRKIGSQRALRSSLFVITPQHNPDGSLKGVSILGGGFGHGVGMCQNGAVGMAQEDYTTAQILQHFYDGSKIHRIY